MANQKKLKIPKPGFGGVINGAFIAVDAGMNIAEGQGVVKSVLKAGVDFAINDAIMGVVGIAPSMAFMGVQLAGAGVDAGLAIGREKAQKTRQNFTGIGKIGGDFNDNRYSATMRQRSMQSIGGNSGMVRNAMGNEARKRASSISY